jgi:hypothetical protein
MLGTMFTPNRDRARLYGFFAHLGLGWVFPYLRADLSSYGDGRMVARLDHRSLARFVRFDRSDVAATILGWQVLSELQ